VRWTDLTPIAKIWQLRVNAEVFRLPAFRQPRGGIPDFEHGANFQKCN
jgi:hypothetical protein